MAEPLEVDEPELDVPEPVVAPELPELLEPELPELYDGPAPVAPVDELGRVEPWPGTEGGRWVTVWPLLVLEGGDSTR